MKILSFLDEKHIFSKGVLLPFKTSPFTLQNEPFYPSKGVLLQAKTSPFEQQKDNYSKRDVFCCRDDWSQFFQNIELPPFNGSVSSGSLPTLQYSDCC